LPEKATAIKMPLKSYTGRGFKHIAKTFAFAVNTAKINLRCVCIDRKAVKLLIHSEG